MNKSELIEAIANKAKQPKQTVEQILEATGHVVRAVVANGDEVTLPGICKVGVAERAARTGRNPSTGAELKIPAKRVPKLGAIKALKDAAAG